MSDADFETLTIAGREVRITHPDKPYFSRAAKLTKLDLVRYYLAVAPGALQGIHDRPFVLKRFVDGAEGEPFYQKRAPAGRPGWLRTVTLSFPSGRTAEEVVVDDAAGLAFVVNLGCIELHPHPVRTGDLDHPDELRVDLDPTPGVAWADIRRVALEVRALLGELGLTGWPKTSGSRGIHVNVRIQPRWAFGEVRRAALALSREIERRLPGVATSKWWKEERRGVFLDYNQNAKDRTTCSAYSVRPLPDARVSAPLSWDEVPDCEPADFTVATMPARFAASGDRHAGMDAAVGSLDALLELAARDDAAGLPDAPWPPQFAKAAGEPTRVQPSRARRAPAADIPTGAAGTGSEAPAPRKSRAAALNSAHPRASGDPAAGDDGRAAEAGSPPARGRAAELPVGGDTEAPGADAPAASPTGRRKSKMPLIVVAQSPDKAAALAGLARWQARHPQAAARLAPDDVLVDGMRGRSSVWTRIRVNLRHVPEAGRPPPETPDPDDDPTRAWRELWQAFRDAPAPKPGFALPEGLSMRALRALALAGLLDLERIAARTETELAALHGVGPKAIGLLRSALASRGLAFRG